jgi:DNA modification methylase
MTRVLDQAFGERWALYHADCVDAIDAVPDRSVGLSVFSPPFPSMYVYSATDHDVGNTRSIDEMIDHFRFLVEPEKLRRVMMPGRLACIHLMQIPTRLGFDGYVGIVDFRGRVIQLMQEQGWVYQGEACIEKNPQAEATRNKEHGLLFKTLGTDATRLRMALADYLLYFRAPGSNPVPVKAGIHEKYNADGGWVTQEDWIEWASPIWARKTPDRPRGIDQTKVLQVRSARDEQDERHLCPLQLDVIERAVRLWSNPDEVVLSPFAGVGSEGAVSLREGRRFVGFELKRSYWETACRNLREAEEAAGGQMEMGAAA